MAEHATNGDKSARPHHGLGLAGGMARTFIHSPLSPLLLLACLAMGILGLLITPRQEDPQISVPMVDVFLHYPGAGAEQVASLAIDPLERMMSEIPGVKHVYSASQRGQGMVTVQFDVGEGMETSLVKLYDKLESNKDKIPPGVVGPMVKPKGVDDVPVVALSLWSHEVDDSHLRLIALDVMQRLKEVPNTSQTFIVGGRSEELRIEVYPERLKGFGVGLDQIAETIKNANSERGTGHVESGDSSFKVYTGAFLRRASDVERLVVGVRNGSPVYVRDIAQVTEQAADARDIVTYYTGPAYGALPEAGSVTAPSGAAAVTIAVAKKPGTNGVTVANSVLEKVDYLRGRLVPDNVQVAVTRNYGATANDKVNELVFKLFVATGGVTLLIWGLLGFRAAVVVLIVIPVVILVTVFSAWLLGYTIDRVSLFALIFSIGILVDDAIVVVENIYRRWLEKGDTDTETSVDAVREVGNPTILATFTVIAALLPMGFVSGMMGPYMEPIPALGSVAMLFSLFAAFIFTPWLAMRIRPSLERLRTSQQKEHKQVEWFDRFYRKTINPLVDSRIKGFTFLFTIMALFFGCLALFYTTDVAVKMLPFDNKSEFNIVVNMPDGTALPLTANVTQRLSEELLKIPEVTAVQSYAGTASPFNFNGLVRHYYLRQDPWYGDIQVQLKDKGDRKRSSHEIATAARERLTQIARGMGARIAVVEMPPGPPVLQTLVAEIYGPDAETRRQAATDLTALFAATPGVVDVDNLMQDRYTIWRFDVDREKAVRHGVSVEDVNRQLDMALGSARLGDIKIGRVLEPRYIVLQVPMELRSQFSRLGEIPVPSATGSMIPLSELGRFEPTTQDPVIFHKDLRPVEFVTGDVSGRLGAPIYGMLGIERQMAAYKAPDGSVGYRSPDGSSVPTQYIGPPEEDSLTAFEWTGEWTVTYETFRDMGIAFAAAMILIYMLVVWEFGNFMLPAIIMAPIPLTLIGIVPGHWVFGAEFTATSMIGFIALAGIIVRNSILLVDFSKQAVDAGEDVREAVIQSCRTRTRPILITALALVLGSSVILTDPIFQGMAITLMFGVAVSTLLTLVVIPLGCVSAASSFLPVHHPGDPVLPPTPDGGGNGGGNGGTHDHGSAGTGGVMATGAAMAAPASQPMASSHLACNAPAPRPAPTAAAAGPGLFTRIGDAVSMAVAIIRLPFMLLMMALGGLLARKPKPEPAPVPAPVATPATPAAAAAPPPAPAETVAAVAAALSHEAAGAPDPSEALTGEAPDRRPVGEPAHTAGPAAPPSDDVRVAQDTGDAPAPGDDRGETDETGGADAARPARRTRAAAVKQAARTTAKPATPVKTGASKPSSRTAPPATAKAKASSANARAAAAKPAVSSRRRGAAAADGDDSAPQADGPSAAASRRLRRGIRLKAGAAAGPVEDGTPNDQS